MKKKLTLNKEKITKLTNQQSILIKGGNEMAANSVRSTNRTFTCCWCTGGDDSNVSCNSCTVTKDL